MTDLLHTTQDSTSARCSVTRPRATPPAAALAATLVAACLLNIACPPQGAGDGGGVQVRLVLPEGRVTYLSEAPRISIQPHRYVAWKFDRPTEGTGTVHPNATIATTSDGPLRLAVAIDADKPDAPEANVVRVNMAGEVDFHQAVAIPLQPTPNAKGRYAFGPGVTTLQVDGQNVPVTLRGEYVRDGSYRSLKLGLECVLQGQCRFGSRVLTVRIADGDGNGRLGDLVVPMRREGKVVGRTPGDTVNIDLGNGTFAAGSPLIRAMYGQPVYLEGAWWDVRITSDRRSVFAHPLTEDTGWVRIHNRYWEAMVIGSAYVFREYYDPSAETFPLPPGRYVVMRYKQWTEPDMSDEKPALLIETPFGRNGPFLLRGNEQTLEVSSGQILDLPIGTAFLPNLNVSGDDASRQYRFACRVTDASGSTPQYVRTAPSQPLQVTVTVLDRDGEKLSEIPMPHAAGLALQEGSWSAQRDARGPFTAVASLNFGDFPGETQRVTFGPVTATVEVASPLALPAEAAELSAPVTLVAANSSEQTYTWRVARKIPARMVFGLVEDARSASPKRIATDYEGTPASSAKDYTLALTRAGDRLNVEIRHQDSPDGGHKGRVWSTTPWPPAAELVNVSTLTAATVTPDSYLALWEGAFLRDGQEVKRVTFLLRLAAPAEPVVNMLGQDDAVKDVVPAQATQRTDATALRFLHLAELEARLVAEHAAALEDLGPNHRGTAMLRDLLDKARKERQEAQGALTRPQRQQLLTAAQPTGPGVLLHSLEQQLKQLEAELGPGHRQVNDLRRRVEAVRQFMKDLQQDLQSATTAPSTAPAPK